MARGKKEALSLAAGQLGERHPSKLAFTHSLNWHGSYQVRQWPVVEGPVDNVKNGVSARSSVARQLGKRHPAKNMDPQSLNWHGASRANSREGADFMAEQTYIKL